MEWPYLWPRKSKGSKLQISLRYKNMRVVVREIKVYTRWFYFNNSVFNTLSLKYCVGWVIRLDGIWLWMKN